MIRTFPLLTFLLLSLALSSQENISSVKKPKLIVGIVVDQMRNDYLYRYWDRYSAGGFKRLVSEGFYCRNAHFNYIPTYTGPGHCSIYTGTTPRHHGVIANDWYSKESRITFYCVEDSACKTIGSNSKAGRMSPKYQLSSTIGDELRMSSNNRSKVFAVAIKDRSAVLPAGHAANGAFWLDETDGNFISSSWYGATLPAWLETFNAQNLAKQYLEKGWNTLYPIASYSQSITDSNEYESIPFKKTPTFPYSFENYLAKKNYSVIKGTPFGNSITKDLALTCLKNEQLGKDEEPDLLCISFSSSDIVAHSFGPRAVEIEDLYLRLDNDISEILITLDREIGEGNYTIFLTADHGGADVAAHLQQNKIPSGYIREADLVHNLKQFFKTNYGDTLLYVNMSNEQIFLNNAVMKEKHLDQNETEERICQFLLSQRGIAEAYPSKVLKYGSYEKNDTRALLQNGYNLKLSGNICYTYLPAWMDYARTGTTHGSGYNYDTHVPVIFYGSGIRHGESQSLIGITQIAPTVCELLRINQPNSCTSEPISDCFK